MILISWRERKVKALAADRHSLRYVSAAALCARIWRGVDLDARALEDGNARTLFFEVATQEAGYIFLTYIKRLDFRVKNVG